MASKPDYYEVLGVARTCGPEELKAAYRRQALKYHPDRNPGDQEAEEKFKCCAEAYEVLSNPEKRSVYDQFGHSGLSSQGYQGFGGFDDIFSHFSDIFSEFFGFEARPRRGMAGADLRYDLEIDFETAIFGGEVELEIPRRRTCQHCQGSGAKPGSAPEPCPTCRGRGQVYRSQGFFRMAATCPTCQGQGRVINDPCPACGGQGRREEAGRVKVRIPAGVDQGARLRLRAEGEAGLQGGPAGDLYVVLHVKPHEVLERQGSDLVYNLRLNLAQAALGLEVEVPTLEEPKTLKIPAGVQNGQVFSLRGQGVPHLRGFGRGDLLVQVAAETPRDLTARQKELLQEFMELEEAKGGGFFSRLKGRKPAKAKPARRAEGRRAG